MPDEIILHIGASKCGSSALQAALSRSKTFTTSEERKCIYAVLGKGGQVLFGEELAAMAERSLTGYLCTNSTNFSDASWDSIASGVSALDADAVILSNEAWTGAPENWRERISHRLGYAKRAVMYVRPQVSLLNSGWWQWAAWQDLTLEQWVETRMPRLQWSAVASNWKAATGIELTIRLLTHNIVGDFFAFLGADPGQAPKISRVNKGLPSSLLRLYQRHRHLRPGPHDSSIDFILSKYVGNSDGPPWVLDQDTISRVIEQCRADNLALLDVLDSDTADSMRDDPRWWDAAAYSDKSANVEAWRSQPPDAEELDRLCADLAQALFEQEKAKRSLHRSANVSREGALGRGIE